MTALVKQIIDLCMSRKSRWACLFDLVSLVYRSCYRVRWCELSAQLLQHNAPTHSNTFILKERENVSDLKMAWRNVLKIHQLQVVWKNNIPAPDGSLIDLIRRARLAFQYLRQ